MFHTNSIRFCLAVLLAVGAASALRAQDLHVYFDALTDSTHYVQNGRATQRPVVRKGSQVVLHVSNYNNYLYNVQMKCQDAAKNAPGNPLQLAGLDGLDGNPMAWLLGGGSPLDGLSGLMMPPVDGGTSGWGGKEQDRDLKTDALTQQVKAFQAAVNRAEARAEELDMLEAKAQMMVEAQHIQQFAAVQLKELCLNPQLSPTQLRALTQEYMTRIFGEADPKNINLTTVIQSADANKQFATINADYHRQVQGYAADVAVLQSIAQVLEDMEQEGGSASAGQMVAQSTAVVATAEENLVTFQGNAAQLDTLAENIQGLDIQELADLRIHYLSIMENDFQKTFRQTATGDVMDFQLTFTPIDSINHTGLTSRTVQPVAVKVYGGMQVNASVGLGFGQFFERPQAYYVRDSIIQQQDKDAFTPYLSSFVHFYPQSMGEVSLGGTFGVGLPIGSGSSLDAMTFFLGPSLIVGREQRIVLSAGLIGGRVEQLASGYAAGDRLDIAAEFLPTTSVYQLGYSVGLSFNLMGR